jgi:thiol-disulfide isomerase/thioredoxin
MRFLILVAFIFFNSAVMAQTPTPVRKDIDVSKDSTTGFLIFNGTLTVDDLLNEPSFDWMKKGMDEYTPNQEYIKYLQQVLPQYQMAVFLGTWCDDSHYLVPKLMKVLQATGFPTANLTMYGVDRKKNTKSGDNTKYGITNVPTIILLKDGVEKGRITETVKLNIETDLTNIVSH